MPSASQMISDVAPNSLRVASETLSVVMEDEAEQVERCYLTVHGTPQAFRWLAKLLNEMADTAKASTSTRRGHSVLIDPADLQQVSLESWSSLSLDCRQQLDPAD